MQLIPHFIVIFLPLCALKSAHEKGNDGGHGLSTEILRKQSSGNDVTKGAETRKSKGEIVGDGSQSMTFIVLGSRSNYQNSTKSPVPNTFQGGQSHYLKTRIIHSKHKKYIHGELSKDQRVSRKSRKIPAGNAYGNTSNTNQKFRNGINFVVKTGPSIQKYGLMSRSQEHDSNEGIDISSGISESDFKAINSLDDVQENLKNILDSEKENFGEHETAKTRGNIVKAIDHIDNIQDAYDKGLMSDDAFDQVDNADRGTLSDYFSAIDKGEKNQETIPSTVSTPLSTEKSAPTVEEQESKGHKSDFYEAIDQGQLPNHSADAIVAHLTQPVSKNKGKLRVTNLKSAKMRNHNKLQKENNEINLVESTTNAGLNGKKTSHHSKQTHSSYHLDVMSVDTPEKEASSDGSENYHSSGFGDNQLLYNGEDVTAFVHPLRDSPLVFSSAPVRLRLPQTLRNNANNDSKTIKQSSQFFQHPNMPIIPNETESLSKMHFMKESSRTNSSVKGLQNGVQLTPKFKVKLQNSKNIAANFHLPSEHSVKGPLVFTSVENAKGTTITGGKISGGQITGGLIQGGQIKSGFIEGGVIRGGRVEGGRIKNGTMEGGAFINGIMEGGRFIDGSIEGGLLKGGNIYGGKITGGKVDGGNMKGGVVEGGRLSGGNMQGGVLKGGEMQSGNMKGGSMEGGILKGGNIEGGRLKFGKLFGGTLKSGIMLGGQMTNGTIDGGTLKGGTVEGGVLKGGVMEGGKLKGGVVLAGKIRGGTIEGGIIEGGEVYDGVVIKGGIINGTVTAGGHQTHVNTEQSNVTVHSTERQNNALNSNLSTGTKLQKTPKISKPVPLPLASRVLQGKEQTQMLDDLSFGVPTENFNDLIWEMKGGPKNLDELVNFWNRPSKDKNRILTGSDGVKQIPNPTKPRSSVTRHGSYDNPPKWKSNSRNEGKLKSPRKWREDGNLKPTYHWSLDELIGDRIPGSPGAAMITHGKIKSIRGGLSFNGYDAWLGAGDFAGGCISDPDRCADGLSFEMTLKLGADTLRRKDISYIVDSGASTFTSKGFTLYTWRGHLRADIAIANQEFCLKSPINTDHWQDVLITWHKEEGMSMYVNCQLKAQTKGDEDCLGCQNAECHMTDTNTRLMIGRPNFSPHFHCSNFESGDITFWERYLRPRDITSLCRLDTGTSKPLFNKGINSNDWNQFAPSVFVVNRPLRNPVDNIQAITRTPAYVRRLGEPQWPLATVTRQLFNHWSAWSACSKSCGYGRKVRRRSCVNTGLLSTCASNTQSSFCYSRPCAVFRYRLQQNAPQEPLPILSLRRSDFHRLVSVSSSDTYGDWSAWTSCDRSCGGGAQVRTRLCNKRSTAQLKPCRGLGPSIQVRRCNRQACREGPKSRARSSINQRSHLTSSELRNYLDRL